MILKQGYLMKRKVTSRQIEPYTMRFVEESELNQVMNLQQLVYDKLPNKEVLYRDSLAEMQEDLNHDALIIGVFNSKEQLIAYRYISFPGTLSKNLGHDIGLPTAELSKVVHLETTLVNPEYRGNRLQSLTLEKAIEVIEPYQMKHLLCTVSPFNFFSLYNIMSSGLRIEALKRKYETQQQHGIWRFILHKDLSESINVKPNKIKSVEMDNIQLQRDLIENGYIGYNLIKETQMVEYSQFC